MNTAPSRSSLLESAASIVDDMTVSDQGPGKWRQINTYNEVSQILRSLAKIPHEAVKPFGGERNGSVKLDDPYLAMQRYIQHLRVMDIHCVKVSIGDDGEVQWRERADAMLAEFLPELDVMGKMVLSVGSNSGGDIAALLDAGVAHVTGLEMMPELVSLSSALLILGGAEHARWRIVGGKIEDWDACETFDVVYNVGVLYHVEDPMRVLRRCYNTLRPGGTLALETEVVKPGRHGELGCADVICWPLREPGYVKRGKNWPTWFIPSEEALTIMLRACGFAEVRRLPATIAKAAFVARKP